MTVGRRKYVKPLYDAMDAKGAAALYEKGTALVSSDWRKRRSTR